ncbi:MAG: twin transmembrane helix small protein [Gammaproteobacteria bacterium]
MLFKLIIVGLFVIIVVVLARAFVNLVEDRGRGTRTVRALSWRIGLSLLLFALLILGYFMGWIHPHGISQP